MNIHRNMILSMRGSRIFKKKVSLYFTKSVNDSSDLAPLKFIICTLVINSFLLNFQMSIF